MNHLHFLDNQKRLDRLDRRRRQESHALWKLALILSALLLVAVAAQQYARHDVPVNAVTR